MEYENISIGADPEVFLRNNDGVYIPCVGVVGGTKEEPNYFSEEGHALQEDNVMLEFNIPPSKSKQEFIDNLDFSMKYILDSLDDDLGIEAIPSVEFSWDDLEHPQAKMSGCSPFFDVYSKEEKNISLDETNIRYAGGHVHFGYDNPTVEKTDKLIPAFDMFLGLPSLFLDTDERRRQTYGKAGMFRFKDYGFEYRSLSNFWLQSEELMGWIYDNIMEAVEFIEEGGEVPEGINEIINNSNKQKAKEIINDYSIQY